jgi:inosine-uridine nucleoside N-ribohydrolase
MRTFHWGWLIAVGLASSLAVVPAEVCAEERRVPVLVDTDLGNYLDDAFAVALLVASPEVELRGVTTCGGDAETRAWMACRFLTSVERRDVPVAWGRPPQAEGKVEAMYQYRYHPAVLFGRTSKPAELEAAELMHRELKKQPGEITILALGPLTNVARLLEKHPEAKPWIKQIVAMGGAIDVGLDGGKPAPEWNIKTDILAARKVLAAGVPVRIVPLDVTWKARLSREDCASIFARQTPLTQQLQLLYQLGDEETPVVHDAVAVSACLDSTSFSWTGTELVVDDAGMTRLGRGKTNAQVATSVRREDVMQRLVERIEKFGERVAPREARNVSRSVERGGLPRRVHVFEDYETEIEKKWWLAGRVEAARVEAARQEPRPPNAGAGRHCRGVLTLDFDDLQGDLKTLYTACVFNPVPGPPMGERTRLAFRYKLTGTDKLRIQLYSLTNGYHRQLTLAGLPENEWREATVDMTAMRRPDGSGGPLAKDERIDDIQFYVAPTAGVLIDDIVLYDAALKDEQQPFPQRLVFTGWFDTGKQGQEWPGDFEIVPHEPPRTWKAARSVVQQPTGEPWIRLSFRGLRPVGAKTAVRFAYRLSGSKSLRLELANSKTGKAVEQRLDAVEADAWGERTVELDTSALEAADELRLFAPRGGTLWIDDVLVFEPGQ